MKTLKNLVLGVLFVCLIAACSKEEPKPCECDIAKNTSPEVPQTVDCSVPKTKKITVQTQLSMDSQGNIKVAYYNISLLNYEVFICNQEEANKIVSKFRDFKSGMLVTIEACESETYYQPNRSPLTHLIFLNIISIKPN
jgi:hypothetical protein